MNSFSVLTAILSLGVVALSASAQDNNMGDVSPEVQAGASQTEQPASQTNSIRSLGTTITGNQEQPKVLYIVPWKTARDEAAIPYQPISGQTDSVFRHTERREHLRYLEFLQELDPAE